MTIVSEKGYSMYKVSKFPRLLALVVSIFAALCMYSASAEQRQIDARVFNCDRLFSQPQRQAVIIILGDTAIARNTEQMATAQPTVFSRNPINGLCYPAGKQLTGIASDEASPWIRMANLLLRKERRERVLLVPLLTQHSPIDKWRPPHGSIFQRLADLISALQAMNISIDAIIWQHGLKNEPAISAPSLYEEVFDAMLNQLRTMNIQAPLFVALTGSCPGAAGGPVRSAQTAVIDSQSNVFSGPDLVSFDSTYFHEAGCALNQMGLERYAQAWAETLRSRLHSSQ